MRGTNGGSSSRVEKLSRVGSYSMVICFDASLANLMVEGKHERSIFAKRWRKDKVWTRERATQGVYSQKEVDGRRKQAIQGKKTQSTV